MKRMGSISFSPVSADGLWGTLAHRVDPTPPIGTPSAAGDKGNSTRLRPLVAGKTKSERSGEPWGQK